jgi:hypothetical protein
MSSTTTTPNLPTPPGVDHTDEWQNDSPTPYRILIGELRGIDGLDVDLVSVQATAVQYTDGRIDDGSVLEPPHVYLEDDALTSAQARALAVTLLETANGVDGWLTR